MDLKNTLEIVESIKILAVAGKKISKDGITLADIPEAVELLKHIDVFVAAFKDAKEVVGEVKDLDQAELLQLGTALYGVFKEVKEA